MRSAVAPAAARAVPLRTLVADPIATEVGPTTSAPRAERTSVNQASLRVIVSSSSPAVRTGLRELVSRGGFVVVDTLAATALVEADLDDVDVVVIDLGDDDELRGALDGELAEVPAVLLTDRASAPDPEAAARAWLAPDAREEALAAAIAAVAVGLTVYASEVGPAGEPGAVSGGSGEIASITEREHDVLVLLAAGLPNKAIARQLGISEHTVKFHVGSLLSKFDAQSRTEAVTIAARQGLLTL